MICNACGLYLKARNTSRPSTIKRQPTTCSPIINPEHHRSRRSSASPSSGERLGHTQQSQYIAANTMPTGTCPGNGHCNGTGGASGCNGCPAYNNRVSKTIQVSASNVPQSGHGVASPRTPGAMEQVQDTAASTVVGQEYPRTLRVPRV